MLRQGDAAENKVGGQPEQTDVFTWPSEALEHKEWSRKSAKNSLLWNRGMGVGVNNGWSFNNVEIISTHDLAFSLSLPLSLKLFRLTWGGTAPLWAATLQFHCIVTVY